MLARAIIGAGGSAFLLAPAGATDCPEAGATLGLLAVESPRIAALKLDFSARGEKALQAFWSGIGSRGAPLVELLPGRKGEVLVTFLWRTPDRAPQHTIGVRVNYTDWEENGEPSLLAHLPCTDAWYRSFLVPADARFHYRFARPHAGASDPMALSSESFQDRMWDYFQDRLNPRSIGHLSRLNNGPENGRLSYVAGPAAKADRYGEPQLKAPAGRVVIDNLSSAALGNSREIAIYTPHGYLADGPAYPLLLMFDGAAFRASGDLVTILDNMIAARAIVPLVAVFVDSIDDEARHRDLAPDNAAQGEFLSRELLPWIRARTHVSRDPVKATVGGASFSGLAAAAAALEHPDLFRNVIALSGSYWWRPAEERRLRIRGRLRSWLADRYAERELPSMRFFMDVGQWEQPEMILLARDIRDVLQAQGHHVRYQEFNGGHDFANWRVEMQDALIQMFGREQADPDTKSLQ